MCLAQIVVITRVYSRKSNEEVELTKTKFSTDLPQSVFTRNNSYLLNFLRELLIVGCGGIHLFFLFARMQQRNDKHARFV